MKKGTKILLGVAAGGVVGALIWAATRAQGAIPPPPPPPSPPPPGKATLYGQVTSGGKPVAGAEVFAVGIGVVAQSDASGNYIAPDLNLGAVSVSCSKTGYSITTKILTLVEGNNRYDFVLTMLTAVLDLKTIQVAPDNPYVGGLVSIFVTGDAPVAGAYSVSLKVDGILVDTQTVQLGAGYTGYIGLTWTPPAAGVYRAEVGLLSITFTVVAGGSPTEFIVPQYPTSADAAALKNKILASPYRGGGGYPSVTLIRWD
ncbi:MAG: carboxypeptidase regulatory-like domain-containing protein, partial [Dehalococcoidia bacterium]|nr:carboxypeptidase regulatory-like domain-containing protein [Dehalococcoidia bacterium]